MGLARILEEARREPRLFVFWDEFSGGDWRSIVVMEFGV
jgi:hypothetical protein